MEKCQNDIDRYYQDPESERQDQMRKAKYDEAVEEYAKLEKLRDEVVKKMLDTFKHFVHEDIRHIYDDILQSKLTVTPWVNLYGVEETESELGHSLWAFEVVWMFWVLDALRLSRGCSQTHLGIPALRYQKAAPCRATHLCKACEAVK
jgi:hypothetical protein